MVQGKASPQFALEVLFLGPSDKELRNDLIKFPPLCPGPFQLCFWLTGTKAAGRGCTAGSLGSLVWLCSEAAAGSGVGRHYRGTSSPAHPPLPATTSLLPNGLWCLPPSSASARESSSPPLPGVDQSPPSWRASPNPVGSLFWPFILSWVLPPWLFPGPAVAPAPWTPEGRLLGSGPPSTGLGAVDSRVQNLLQGRLSDTCPIHEMSLSECKRVKSQNYQKGLLIPIPAAKPPTYQTINQPKARSLSRLS